MYYNFSQFIYIQKHQFSFNLKQMLCSTKYKVHHSFIHTVIHSSYHVEADIHKPIRIAWIRADYSVSLITYIVTHLIMARRDDQRVERKSTSRHCPASFPCPWLANIVLAIPTWN